MPDTYALFDTFKARVTLTGTLTARTALRIGAGRSTAVADTDLPVVRNALGDPYIPGSSLKGALRAYAESIVRGVCGDSRKAACNPVGKSEGWCLPSTKGMEDHAVVKGACLVCRVFGSHGLASTVSISDLPVASGMWIGQFETRNGVAIERDTETASDGKLYDFEVVPAGTTFTCRIVAENADPWQMGLLMAALRPFSRGEGALGGARSRGLGVAEIAWVWDQCENVTRDGLLDWLTEDKAAPVSDADARAWLAAFKARLIEWNAEEADRA